MANTASHPTRIKNPTTISAKEYAQTLAELKKQIQESQVKAALAANNDLRNTFPGIAGFSRTNIFKMEAELEKQEILLEESTKQKEN